MALYLDIKAVRIQTYLTRWPQLRGIRGASALLSQQMAAENLVGVGNGWKPNKETGNIDGKLSVTVDDPLQVHEIASEIILGLQDRLPGAEFEAIWEEADTYIEAYIRMPSTPQIAVPRTTAHWPAARVCDLCELDTACQVEDLGFDGQEKLKSMCPDCAKRNISRSYTVKKPLVRDEALARSVHLKDSAVPKDFNALADCGPPEMKRNHLAVVYSDANKMGVFFKEAIEDGVDAVDLSKRLTEETWEALVEATACLVNTNTKTLPVMPHIIGGDDILVSVPAAYAWEFTMEFLTALDKKLGALVEGRSVTASAGIAIAHASHPFAQTVQTAERLLGRAKGQFAGDESSILWQDLTREGEPLKDRPAITLSDLTERAGYLSDLAALPKSTRSALDRAASDPDPEVAAAKVGRVAERHGIRGRVAPFLSGPLVLPDALDISRWWR